MTRLEETKMIINEMERRRSKLNSTGTYNDFVKFELCAITTMLADISKSLAVIADKAESEDKKMKDC